MTSASERSSACAAPNASARIRHGERRSRASSCRSRPSRLAERGIADKSLLKQAVDADPENARAREQLLELSRVEPPSDRRTRYAIAGAIGLSALLGVLFILLRPRTPLPNPPAADDEPR